MKLKYIVTAFLAVCLLSGNLQAQSTTATLSESRRLWDNQRYDAAIALALKVIDKEPNNVQANWLCATAYLNLDIYSEALRYYKKLVEINNSLVSYSNLSGAYANLGYDSIAIATVNKGLELDPDYLALIGNRGGIHSYHYRIDEALSDYMYVIEMDPSRVPDYFNLGVVYILIDDYETSKKWLETCLAMDPNNPETIMLIEDMKIKINPKFKRSKKTLNTAIELYSEKLDKNRYDGYLFFKRGTVYEKLGKKELAKADYIRALALFDEVIADVPDAPRKRFIRAKIYQKLGDKKNAIAEYEQVLKLNPSEKEAKKQLENLKK